MADSIIAPGNSEQVKRETGKVRDHLRAAGSAAAGAIRENAGAAAQAARKRARGASDWARSRWSDLQGQVEEKPHSAAIWALGIGVVAGILVSTLFHGHEHRDRD
jgi:ElaB/YqjD/DUF883 family membrane-anchored ribosome-binding protein